jgi:hypothetical protein
MGECKLDMRRHGLAGHGIRPDGELKGSSGRGYPTWPMCSGAAAGCQGIYSRKGKPPRIVLEKPGNA